MKYTIESLGSDFYPDHKLASLPLQVPLLDTIELMGGMGHVWGEFTIDDEGKVGRTHEDDIPVRMQAFVGLCDDYLRGDKIAREALEQGKMSVDILAINPFTTVNEALGLVKGKDAPENTEVVKRARKAFEGLIDPSVFEDITQDDIDAAQQLLGGLAKGFGFSYEPHPMCSKQDMERLKSLRAEDVEEAVYRFIKDNLFNKEIQIIHEGQYSSHGKITVKAMQGELLRAERTAYYEGTLNCNPKVRKVRKVYYRLCSDIHENGQRDEVIVNTDCFGSSTIDVSTFTGDDPKTRRIITNPVEKLRALRRLGVLA